MVQDSNQMQLKIAYPQGLPAVTSLGPSKGKDVTGLVKLKKHTKTISFKVVTRVPTKAVSKQIAVQFMDPIYKSYQFYHIKSVEYNKFSRSFYFEFECDLVRLQTFSTSTRRLQRGNKFGDRFCGLLNTRVPVADTIELK